MTLPALLALVPASIPSPSSGRLGPLHMYGLMIALGVIAAIELSRARWRARGGNPDDIYAIAIWAVPAGLVGARLYHVATDWNRLYSDGRWVDAFKIWNGGLGIPGGIAVGVSVGVWVAYRRNIRLAPALDAVVPTLALAQAIGRVGNWWNQELFGRPSDLPWAVRISPEHRPLKYLAYSTFHPTFLYELLWDLALCGFLIWLDRKRVLRPGQILPLYIGGYFLGRLWVEALRSDVATHIFGVRVNIWMSLIGIVGATIAFLWRGVRRRPGDSDEPYRDGHRWDDPDRVPAAVGATTDGEIRTDGEPGDEGAGDGGADEGGPPASDRGVAEPAEGDDDPDRLSDGPGAAGPAD